MARRTPLLMIVTACMLAACSDAHLDIFPPLKDPALMDRKLVPEALRQDIDAFYEGALARHPNLAEYADQAALQATLAQLKTGLKTPLTRVEFFRQVGQLTHTFGDGHSMLIWPYQEYEQLQKSGQKPFPFRVHIDVDDQIFIRQNYQDQAGNLIAAGSKITAVNGVKAAELVDSMQRYVGGETEYLRKQFVAGRFPIYLWAVHGIIGDLSLELETEDGHKTLAISNTHTWQAADSDAKEDEDFYVTDLGDGAAYLHVGHFDIDPDWFEGFIDDAFRQIAQMNAKSLIIDVRANTGGNTDTALYLTRYLADRRFRMVSKVREKLNPDNRGALGYKGAVGDIIDTVWDDWIDPVSEDKRFKGDTYVLISPITYSSGIVFASTMKDFRFATLVGQETGGFANQTAQGNLFNLPHSKLRAYITTRMLVRPSGSLAPGGVKPDYAVLATRQTISDGKDVELEQALELIRRK